MLNDLFKRARKAGLTSLESDIEEPEKSEFFKNYPEIMKHHHTLQFICDTLRTAMAGTVSHFDLDQLIELDLEVHHHEVNQPVTALSTVADALPGLGIVAAVLGIVITMSALGGPPEEIGKKVAAALVGTFLGILLCYGFLSPLAAKISRANDEESHYYHTLRTGLIAFVRGAAPALAVEFSRRTIPSAVRPSFKEMDQEFRGKSEQLAA
ncbi:MAG: flagellar motor stator protein MotA [Acidobacteriaceae bacterium]|nr:flagellar motor stator protein MotA [Acidobacteriaceae bacterium]